MEITIIPGPLSDKVATQAILKICEIYEKHLAQTEQPAKPAS